jgi:uncharacterized protein YbaP (TraB family)
MASHVFRLRSAVGIFFWICLAPGALALDCVQRIHSNQRFESAGYSHANLWRVATAGGQVNYIFGTIHLADPRVTRLPRAVAEALSNSESFGMEVVLNSSAIATMSKAMHFVDGLSLEQFLEPELLARTAELLDRYGVSTRVARTLKPWAAFTTFSLPPGQITVPLDLLLMLEAERRGKLVFGLETIEEQIGVLDTLSNVDQADLLRAAVCHYDELQADIETLIKHYVAQDLGAVMQMTLRYSSPLQDRFLDVLLWQRNRRMADKMTSYLRHGGAFIAIGALHLPGHGGVLDILSKRGYTIESIN